VLYLKNELYDVVVTMPPHHNKGAKHKIWPTIECPAGNPVKATQRDLSRYRALKRSLRRYKRRRRSTNGQDSNRAEATQETEDENDHAEASREEQVCEKLSWREIAYSSFMWWASAGEKRRENEAQRNSDEIFFEDGKRQRGEVLMSQDPDDEVMPLLPTSPRRASSSPFPRASHHRRRSSGFSIPPYSDIGNMEMDIVAYFHRLTGKIMSYMAEIVDDADDEDEGVFVTLEDMDKLGLDRYSDGDVDFIKNICIRYFGREATVESRGWACCGLKCC
jgi:hypothetical protein